MDLFYSMTQTKKTAVMLAGLLTVIIGILHLFPVALGHITPFPPLEAGFFALIGVSQIIWGYLFFKKPTKNAYYFGLAVNGGTAVLFLLTRIISAPFQGGPEEWNMLGLVVLILEIIAVISLLLWKETVGKRQLVKDTVLAIITMLIIGCAFYGMSYSMELVFPERTVSHGHGGEEEHVEDSEDEEHNDDQESHDDEDDGHTDGEDDH